MKHGADFLKISYAVLLAFLCMGLSACGRSIPAKVQSIISAGNCQGIYLQGNGTVKASEEDFKVYRGLNVANVNCDNISYEELAKCVELVGNAATPLQECYITVDPYNLWKSCREDSERFTEITDEFTAAVQTGAQNGVTIYEIAFPIRSIDYWVSLDDGALNSASAAYNKFAEKLIGIDNVFVYGYGLEEWLYMNLSNYCDESHERLNDKLNLKMFMSTFCDRLFACESLETLEDSFDILLKNVNKVKTYGLQKADTGGVTVIALGDSIFGSYTDSTSISHVMESISDATVYNCAIAGIDASFDEDRCDFNDLIEIVLGTRTYDTDDGRDDFERATRKLNDCLQGKNDGCGDDLVFVVEFGLNDYFNRHTVAEYKAALERGIGTLSDKFPGARFLLVAPGHIGIFDSGNECKNDLGEVLNDFRNACAEVADSLKCTVYNLKDVDGITAESIWKYTDDGVHYNQYGRYLIAVDLVEILK